MFKKLLKFIFKLTPIRISAIITGFVLVLMFLSTFTQIPGLQIFELIELKIYDFRLLVRGEQRAGENIVLVAIDDKTLDDLGRWPFSRSKMADAVENMKKDGAKVIAWDVLFSEEDKNSELIKVRELKTTLEKRGLDGRGPITNTVLAPATREFNDLRQSLERLRDRIPSSVQRQLEAEFYELEKNLNEGEGTLGGIAKIQQDFYQSIVQSESKANNDMYFAQKISEAGNVILGYFFHRDAQSIAYLTGSTPEQREALIASSRISIIRQPPGFEGYLPGRPIYEEIEPNIPLYSRATPHFGSFTIQQDADGSIRSYPLLVNYRGHSYFPSLALKSVELFLDSPTIVGLDAAGLGIATLQVGPATIPVNEYGSVLVNYRGPGNKKFKTVSFSDVVNNKFPAGVFSDKIALIGPTAIGIMDLRVTPYDQSMPGVEIHANVMDNILESEFYLKPNWMKAFDLFAVLALGITLGIFLTPLSALTIGFVAAGITAIYIFGGQVLLVEYGIWLTTVWPVFNVVLVSIGVTLFKYYTEERQKKSIRTAFQTYMSPAVVEQVIKDPSKLALGGEKRDLTVLFSDLRGFTTISEKLDAEELANLLNEYLTPMTDLVFANDGTLDKYMGDAIMAFWGAPLHFEDHAFKACKTALEMMDRLAIMQKDFAARGLPHIDIGIGLNSGTMSVGNMGSTQRMDYTVMGDAVNLGSRVEGINKEYGTHIIITEFTYARCKGQIWCRELDLVAVKGKKEPVGLYELLGFKPDPKRSEVVERFEQALKIYRKGDFQKSFDLFQGILKDFPDDGPSETFLERSRELINEPPEGEWRGVFVAKSK